MIWLAAAAAATVAPPSKRASASVVVVQATATVRIISGVRLKLDSPTNADAPAAHDSLVIADGAQKPARLIEFQ